MHPTLLPRPFHHDGWVYEEKVDGYRMVGYKDDEGVRLVSRNGRDYSRRFPELVKALGGLKPKSFMLDGEVAILVNLCYQSTFGLAAVLHDKHSARQVLSSLFPSPIVVTPEVGPNGKALGWTYRGEAFLGALIGYLPAIKGKAGALHQDTKSVGGPWISRWARVAPARDFAH